MSRLSKEAFYFPHFSNARNDRKLKRLRKELGAEGYAIYFMLLEVLREQEEMAYPLADCDLLADDFGTSLQKVEAVVARYELFETVDGRFHSPKLVEYMAPYFKMREQRSLAGRASATARKKAETPVLPTSVERPLNESTTIVQQSKVKQSKVKQKSEANRFTAPTAEQVQTILGNRTEAERFVNYYSSKGWMVGKSPMKDWKAAARGWLLRNTATAQHAIPLDAYEGDKL